MSRRLFDDEDRPRKAVRRRGEDDEEEADEEERPRRGQRCTYCGYRGRPHWRRRTALAGWVLFGLVSFVILVLGVLTCAALIFLPAGLLPLLIKEEYRVCADCGVALA